MARGPAQLENRLIGGRGLGHLDSVRLSSAGYSGFGSSRRLAHSRRRGSGCIIPYRATVPSIIPSRDITAEYPSDRRGLLYVPRARLERTRMTTPVRSLNDWNALDAVSRDCKSVHAFEAWTCEACEACVRNSVFSKH